MTKTQRSWTT